MQKGILVVSFGTSHLDTMEKTIDVIERNRGEISGLPCVPCFYEQDDHPQTETHGSYGDRYCGRGGKTHGRRRN